MRPSIEHIEHCRHYAEQRTGAHTMAWCVYHSPYRDFAFSAGGKAVTDAGGVYCDDVAFVPAALVDADRLDLVELFIPHIFEDGSWEALEEATHETK